MGDRHGTPLRPGDEAILQDGTNAVPVTVVSDLGADEFRVAAAGDDVPALDPTTSLVRQALGLDPGTADTQVVAGDDLTPVVADPDVDAENDLA